ncbi:TPM domain-containing protein [Petrocella sp. FN5]|uniref:TPM domain-containing protein n=1 Tax=Petrocella sp. FN5 TaxID=3032002 RepID=UPI0023DBF04D|nr:TPM domain-containing protein [Petrocella sp. FN5]MDF1615855.1 TPM domain-containing protein [Petrocella sp. FN5]
MKKTIAALFILSMLLSMSVIFGQSYPSHTTEFYVNDFAGILSTATEEAIMNISVPLAQETGAQIVVVTVDSLEGQDIESYALNLFREWGIGDATKNNGLLLLVSLNDRRSRIEVGYGLEGALNDAKTGRIQDDYLIGHFQEGNYDAGIIGTYLKLAEEVFIEYGLDEAAITSQNVYYYPSTEEEEGNIRIFHVILIIIGIMLMMLDLIFNRGRMTRVVLYMIVRNSGRGGGSGGSGFGGGGGRSGGGGSSRGW